MIEGIAKQLLIISPNRQRKEFEPQSISDLATSIDSIGLLHPIVVRRACAVEGTYYLVAGERRMRAIEQLWIMGRKVRCSGDIFTEGFYPCTSLESLCDIDAFQAELEENVVRTDLSWQEKATAISRLFELRTLQASKSSDPPPTFDSIAAESASDRITVRERVLVARHLDDPDVAKAPSAREALKVLKRKEELQRSKELGEKVGATFTNKVHELLHGDCTSIMAGLEAGRYDVILTDPPYGINAQNFKTSDGKAQGGHFYDDTEENFWVLMTAFGNESIRITKEQAHLYMFCDVEHFTELREMFRNLGWKTFRTPIVWHNPSGQRSPWPSSGPQRKYQLILYATKGDRNVLSVRPDLVTFSSDDNLNHQAQKPVQLFVDLLSRSVRPGDSVLDPFCGTGTIFPAAHSLKVKATGIELDESAYGIAVKRLEDLK